MYTWCVTRYHETRTHAWTHGAWSQYSTGMYTIIINFRTGKWTIHISRWDICLVRASGRLRRPDGVMNWSRLSSTHCVGWDMVVGRRMSRIECKCSAGSFLRLSSTMKEPGKNPQNRDSTNSTDNSTNDGTQGMITIWRICIDSVITFVAWASNWDVSGVVDVVEVVGKLVARSTEIGVTKVASQVCQLCLSLHVMDV